LRLLQNDGAGQKEGVLEARLAAAISDGEVELLGRTEVGEGNVIDRPGHRGTVHDVDRQGPREMLRAPHEGLRDGHATGCRPGNAKRRGRRHAVDREGIVRAVLRLRKGGDAGREEGDGRSREGTSKETHIPNNVAGGTNVAVRPMQREDVEAMGQWQRHVDPLSRHYDLPVMTPANAAELWAFLSGAPAVRRPYVGVLEGEVVATLIVRNMDPATGGGELGIVLNPAYLGRGLGRRILRAFVMVLANEGFRYLHLEVAGYNGRAIAAYLASGFTVRDEYWADPEPGIDLGSLLDGPTAGAVVPNIRIEPDGRYSARTVRMERRLTH
jgi:RimJ/RimL family protein N-acetyltransferase